MRTDYEHSSARDNIPTVPCVAAIERAGFAMQQQLNEGLKNGWRKKASN